MAIKIRLAGGLGNQLFQLNTALNINESLGSNHEIIVNISFLNKYTANRTPLIADFFDFDYHESKVVFDERSDLVMNTRASKVIGFAIEKGLSHTRGPSIALKASKLLTGNIYLDGYYQNVRPFKLHPCLKLVKKSLLCHALNILDKLDIEHDFYAMHVRRGDYVSDASARKIFNIIDLPFFSYVRSTYFHGSAPLLIFSDDADTANRYANRFGGISLFGNELNTLDEFSLMAMSSGIAISNSTFSWWASVLGGEKPHGIHSPRNWYMKKSLNENNMLNKLKIINTVDNEIC